MTATIEPLSGSTGGAPLALATYPTLTLVHTVPDGETHEITIYAVNTDNSNPHEILGNFGAGADMLNQDIPAESTYEVIRDCVLEGPATVNICKVTGTLRVIGRVKRRLTGKPE